MLNYLLKRSTSAPQKQGNSKDNLSAWNIKRNMQCTDVNFWVTNEEVTYLFFLEYAEELRIIDQERKNSPVQTSPPHSGSIVVLKK